MFKGGNVIVTCVHVTKLAIKFILEYKAFCNLISFSLKVTVFPPNAKCFCKIITTNNYEILKNVYVYYKYLSNCLFTPITFYLTLTMIFNFVIFMPHVYHSMRSSIYKLKLNRTRQCHYVLMLSTSTTLPMDGLYDRLF